MDLNILSLITVIFSFVGGTPFASVSLDLLRVTSTGLGTSRTLIHCTLTSKSPIRCAVRLLNVYRPRYVQNSHTLYLYVHKSHPLCGTSTGRGTSRTLIYCAVRLLCSSPPGRNVQKSQFILDVTTSKSLMYCTKWTSSDSPYTSTSACVTPTSPEFLAQNAIFSVFEIKVKFNRLKSATKFLCVNTSAAKL